MFNRLRSLPRLCRQRGAPYAMLALDYWIAHRLFGLAITRVFRLAAPAPMPSEAAPFTFRPATAEEIRQWASDPINELPASMADRLAAGRDICLAAFHEGRLAAYAWFALQSIEAEHAIGVGLHFPPTTAYFYKALTRPEYRGNRLYHALAAQGLRTLAALGVRELFWIVEWDNQPAVRATRSIGGEPLGWLSAVSRSPWPLIVASRALRDFGLQWGRSCGPVHARSRPQVGFESRSTALSTHPSL